MARSRRRLRGRRSHRLRRPSRRAPPVPDQPRAGGSAFSRRVAPFAPLGLSLLMSGLALPGRTAGSALPVAVSHPSAASERRGLARPEHGGPVDAGGPPGPLGERQPEMRIHLIDVGQGAATLYEFKCGAALV